MTTGVEFWHNKINKFCIIKLHYTADERKRTAVWKESAKAGLPDAAWQQEYEINFEQQRGKRVFGEYSEHTHRKDLQENKELVFYRGWDFGYRRPACVITQIDNNDIWIILQEFLGCDEPLEVFAKKVLDCCPDGKYKDYCDPAGAQSSDKSVRTSIEVLNALNIYPVYKKSSPTERARIIRSKLLIREDKNYGLLINKSCQILHEGFGGGYHYPENPTPNQLDAPEKDGFYDHVFDALGYIAYSVFKYSNPERKKKQHLVLRQRNYNPFTGA
jgi:hypothetical protein